MRGLLDRFPLILSKGQSQRLDPYGRQVDGIIISVTTGVLDIYLGDNTGTVGTLPDFRCVPEIRYQYDLPPARYIFTACANQDVQAVVWLLG